MLWVLQIDKLAKDKSSDGKGKIRQLMLIIFSITKDLFVFLALFVNISKTSDVYILMEREAEI